MLTEELLISTVCQEFDISASFSTLPVVELIADSIMLVEGPLKDEQLVSIAN